METVRIIKEDADSTRFNVRVAHICGDYACITRFEHHTGLPLCNIKNKVRIVVSKDSDWENAHPYDLMFESMDNGLFNKFKNLEQFEEFARA